jgi:uncharacterized protein (DUF3084 family)
MEEILVNNAFKLFASFFLAMGLFILNSLKNEIKEVKRGFANTSSEVSASLSQMKESVAALNVHIAQLIEKDLTKSERLNHHEKTLSQLDLELTSIKEKHHDKISDIHTKIALIHQKVKEIEKDIA